MYENEKALKSEQVVCDTHVVQRIIRIPLLTSHKPNRGRKLNIPFPQGNYTLMTTYFLISPHFRISSPQLT